jgi:WD40 repeat protein
MNLVTSVALSGDGKLVVTGSLDGTAILWEAASGKKLQTLDGHVREVTSVALSKGGKYVLTGSHFENAILWEAASGKKCQTFQGHTHLVMSAALSGDGKHLWTASRDGSTRLWDTATGKELCALLSMDGGKDWLVVTPEGYFDGSAGAWKLVTYRVPGTLKLVDDDATRKQFHRLGLLARVLKGEKVQP